MVLLIIVFATDQSLLQKVADWHCVIRASRAVCASVTAGIDLGWLGVGAAIFGGVLIFVLARAKARTEQRLACAALVPCCLSVERHCAVGVAACERTEEGALHNFRTLRTTAAGAFGEQNEVEDGMLGCEGGIDSSPACTRGWNYVAFG